MAKAEKSTVFSLKRKVDLINASEETPPKSRKQLAADFGISPSTVTKVLQVKEKLKGLFYGGLTNVHKARFRTSKFSAVEDELVTWFLHARAHNVPVTGPILKTKAEELARKNGTHDWVCTQGWLHRFKKRHNISFKVISGEKLSGDEVSADKWVEDVLTPTLTKFQAKDVFNAKETGLLWRALPHSTLSLKTPHPCRGGERARERVSVLVCANMDGSKKYPLLTIGKYQHPRCFKGVKNLPLKYSSNKEAWMTSEEFGEWLRAFDRSMAAQGRKVLLILDSCPAHAKNAALDLKATQVLFLPRNATSKLQPCDQGIVRSMKVHYRNQTLMRLIRHMDEGGEYSEFQVTLLDALTTLKSSWDKVTQRTIANSFSKAGFTADEDQTSLDNLDVDVDVTAMSEPILERMFTEHNISVSDYIDVDKNIRATAPVETITPQNPSTSRTAGLFAAEAVKEEVEEDESEEDNCGSPEAIITPHEAWECVRKLQFYLLQSDNTGAVEAPFLHFKEAFERHMMNTRRQATTTDFFSPTTETFERHMMNTRRRATTTDFLSPTTETFERHMMNTRRQATTADFFSPTTEEVVESSEEVNETKVKHERGTEETDCFYGSEDRGGKRNSQDCGGEMNEGSEDNEEKSGDEEASDDEETWDEESRGCEQGDYGGKAHEECGVYRATLAEEEEEEIAHSQPGNLTWSGEDGRLSPQAREELKGDTALTVDSFTIKLELPWYIEEQSQDQPSAVYSSSTEQQPSAVYNSSTEQLTCDSTSGSPLHFSRSYTCQDCGLAFVLCSSWELHMASVHGEGQRASFPVFPTLCRRAAGVGNVNVAGSREGEGGSEGVKVPPQRKNKQHVCDVCHKAFSRSNDLKKHKRIHTGDRPYVCDVCHRAFTQHTDLKRHRLLHTDFKPFACQVCGKGFIQASHLKRHVLVHSGKRPFQCTKCSKAFPTHGEMSKHMLIHAGEKPYVCDVCDRAFSRGSNLNSHKLIHLGNRPFVCDVCDKSFIRDGDLRTHKLIHKGEKSFLCDICNKGFVRLDYMKKHRMTHSGVRPYVCDVCSKAFTRKSGLLVHKAIHERPFECGHCDRTFSLAADLTKHQLSHLPEVTECA